MAFWHSLFGSSRHSTLNTPQPKSTSPIADGKFRFAFFWTMTKFALLLGIPLALLFIYGQPALRIKYLWNGNARAPVYSQCDYLTLLDGWKIVHPYLAVNNCPLIAFFPFELSHLIGE